MWGSFPHLFAFLCCVFDLVFRKSRRSWWLMRLFSIQPPNIRSFLFANPGIFFIILRVKQEFVSTLGWWYYLFPFKVSAKCRYVEYWGQYSILSVGGILANLTHNFQKNFTYCTFLVPSTPVLTKILNFFIVFKLKIAWKRSALHNK